MSFVPDRPDEVQRLRDELQQTRRRLMALASASAVLRDHGELPVGSSDGVTLARSPIAVSLSRQSDGLYLDVNEEWCQLVGHAREEAVGQTSQELGLLVGSDRHIVDDASALTDQPWVVEAPFTKPDGTRLILQHHMARFEREGRVFLLTYLSNVTAERRAHMALLANGQLLKAANSRLNRQIAFLEAMESLATVGYWTTNPVHGDLRWSGGLYRLAGLTPGSVLDTQASRGRIHPDDRGRFELARQAMDGSTQEYRWLHPDGHVRWLRSRMTQWQEPGEEALDFGIVQDVTDEREATEALHVQLAFIQQITARVPGVMFQMRRWPDAAPEFLYVSEHARALFPGLSPHDIKDDPRQLTDLIHPGDVTALLAALMACEREVKPLVHECRLRLGDGTIRWVLGQAVPEQASDGSVLWNGFVTDITDQKMAADQLRDSEARFRALTAMSSDWYWEQDANFRLTQMVGNPDLRHLLPDQIYLGKTRWELDTDGVSQAQWLAHRQAVQAHQAFRDFEMQRRRGDGSLMWVCVSGAPIFGQDGEFLGYRGIGRDNSQRKLAEETAERLAFYDVLTDLPNRRLLVDRLQQALITSGRERSIGALLFIDLDNFKDLNDTQGHDVGDMLLQQVAQRLLASVREADTVARLGGDEFVVMLQGLDQDMAAATTQVQKVGKKILRQLNRVYMLRRQPHHSTPSMGITLFQDHRQTLEELLKQADLAMYESKAAGRNTMRFFDPAMQSLVARRTELEFDLRRGLQRQELELHYQPVVDREAVVQGVEALVRWRHPKRGLLVPADFIPMAEQSGLIFPIGDWVLEQACRQLVVWAQSSATAHLSVAVNISARQFKRHDFVAIIQGTLEKTGANPQRLKLELTESQLLSESPETLQKMTELQSLGVSFSLDDFGTGYSSLSNLRRLPLQQLKIDQSFVCDVLSDPDQAAIARTVLALGQTMGLSVVAEGVETHAHHGFLVAHGCGLFQGYLYGRPVPVNELDLRAGAGRGSEPATPLD